MAVSESRFNMWRAVVSMIHADDVVKPHEVNFILENTRHLPLSDAQRDMLVGDIRTPSSVEEHFSRITNPRDQEEFFHFARAIAWSDGDFDEREDDVLQKIRQRTGAGRDSADAMQRSARNFQHIYVEGGLAEEDKGFMALVKDLIRVKTAKA